MFAVKSDVKPTFYGTPTIYITESAARFMKKLVDKVSMEVGWLMVCHETDEGDFVLSECIVPGQQCHQTTTELLPEGLEEVIMELIEEDTAAGIATNSDEFRCNHLNAWFHSHDTMGVSPSGQDDQQMTDFCTRYDDAYNVWIRGIVNKAGDIHVTIYYKTSKVWKVVAGCPVEIAWDNEDDDSLSTLVDDTVRSRVKRLDRKSVV